MTASPPFANSFSLGVRLRDVQVALTVWGLYLGTQAGYCLIHTKVVARAPFDLGGLALWALGEWSIWLSITLLVFGTLRRYQGLSKPVWAYVKLAALALAAALSVRIGIDYQTGSRGVAASFVIFLPRYAAALALVILAWHSCLRKGSLALRAGASPEPLRPALASPSASAAFVPPDEPSPAIDSSAIGPEQREEQAVSRPATLLVSQEGDERLIQVDQIQYISAAGNYVEIYCNGQLYLLRATLKQVEALLPPASFLRTHRSHIVRLAEIQCIQARPSGNSVLKLHCGKVLNVSRRYKARLEKFTT